jgi:hypothetical protein
MSKWVRMTHLDIWNTSYGQKKGWKSNWQFDFRPLMVKNHPNFLLFRWCATYRWKVLNEGYNVALDLISIEGLHTKLYTPKVVKVPTLGISGLPLGSLETKWHLGASLMAMHKGEGGGFPQVQAVVNLVTTRNLVIYNHSLCNWHVTNCRLQLSWSCLQLQIWYCIIYGPYGCVCN